MVVVDFADISLPTAMHLIQQTRLLIGMHGAGLTHAVFLKEGSALFELYPYAYQRYKERFPEASVRMQITKLLSHSI